MSSSDNQPSALPPPPPPPAQRSGCLTAIMVLFGVIMLFPGLCALLFGGASVIEGGKIDSDIAPLVFVGLVVGLGGVGLIWAAIKGRNGQDKPER